MLKKMKQSKLYEDVAAQIEESIIQGDFKPGEKLPSERDFEEILGVSRSTIRQSLRILGQKSILKISTGSKGGAFVREITPELISKSISLLIRFNHVKPDHIIEFRAGIEGDLITRLAVENVEQNDIRDLKAMLNRLVEIGQKQGIDWQEVYTLEAQMHQTLAKTTKNPLYEALSRTLIDSTNEYYTFILPRDMGKITKQINDWQNFIQCLEDKNVEKFAQSMRNHILRWKEISKAGSNK